MTAASAESCSKRTNQRPSDEMTQNDSLENISSTVTARAMNAEHSSIAARDRPRFGSATGAGTAVAEREKRRRGVSLNQTAIDLLRRALGLEEAERSNGLAALAGGWSAEDLARFEAAVTDFERVDEELWR